MSVRVYLSVRMNNSAPTKRIFIKSDICVLFENVEKIQVSSKSNMNSGYFTRRTMYVYGNISLNSRNVTDKSC